MRPDKPPEGWHDFVCTYNHNGKPFGITVRATSFEDAKARLWAMQYGTVDGILGGEIPAFPTASLWVRLICWWKNLF